MKRSQVTYGQLLDGKLFNTTMPASWDMNPTGGLAGSFSGATPTAPGKGLQAGEAPAKPPAGCRTEA